MFSSTRFATVGIRTWTRAVVLAAILLVAAGACRRSETHSAAPVERRGAVVFDLSVRLGEARLITESGRIEFGANDVARLGWGWGKPEIRGADDSFAWVRELSAEVVVEVADDRSRRLRVNARPYRCPDCPPQVVQAFAGDVPLGDRTLRRGMHAYEFDVPGGALAPGRNRLRFEFAWCVAPQERDPGSSDSRRLAAAFDSIALEPAARIDADRSASVRDLGGRSFAQRPATVLGWDLTVPKAATLDGRISAPSGGGKAEVWVLTTTGGRHPVHRMQAGGEPVSIATDLSRWAGQRIRLSLVAPPQAGGGVVWHAPVVAGRAEDRPSPPPNLVLVVIDTLRADAIGPYGGDASTPVLDRLAAEGVVFERAYSHIPITGPSHAMMFTSLLPVAHGVHNNAQLLDGGLPVLAEQMRTSGRRTAAFLSLGVLHRAHGLDRGFDHYGDLFPRDWMKTAEEVNREAWFWLDEPFLDPYFLWVHYSDPHEPYGPPDLEVPTLRLIQGGEVVAEMAADGRAQRAMLEVPPGTTRLELRGRQSLAGSYRVSSVRAGGGPVAVRPSAGWIPADGGGYHLELPASIDVTLDSIRSQEVWIELYCVEPLSIEEVRRRYRLEVEYVDRELGRLLARMERLKLMENTLLVVVADHGEGLGDHGLIGHVDQLYDSLLRVPLILRWPGRVPAGLRIEAPVGLVDLWPTVAELLGEAPPPGGDGRSLAPLLAGGGSAPRASLVAETYRPEARNDLRALVRDGFKYIVTLDESLQEELYDLAEDPRELDDLSRSRPELVELMREALADEIEAATGGEVPRAAQRSQLDEDEKARLRALGYVVE